MCVCVFVCVCVSVYVCTYAHMYRAQNNNLNSVSHLLEIEIVALLQNVNDSLIDNVQ